MQPVEAAKNTSRKSTSRLPEKSVFFDRVVPALLAAMAILTVFLILFAGGVLLGFVKF